MRTSTNRLPFSAILSLDTPPDFEPNLLVSNEEKLPSSQMEKKKLNAVPWETITISSENTADVIACYCGQSAPRAFISAMKPFGLAVISTQAGLKPLFMALRADLMFDQAQQ